MNKVGHRHLVVMPQLWGKGEVNGGSFVIAVNVNYKVEQKYYLKWNYFHRVRGIKIISHLHPFVLQEKHACM